VADGVAEISHKMNEATEIDITEARYSNEKRTRELIKECWKTGFHPHLMMAGNTGTAA
jgi:hypothetical protein